MDVLGPIKTFIVRLQDATRPQIHTVLPSLLRLIVRAIWQPTRNSAQHSGRGAADYRRTLRAPKSTADIDLISPLQKQINTTLL